MEHFVDAPSDTEDTSGKNNNTSETDRQMGSHTDTIETRQTETKYSYKPHQRNPLYVGAEHSCAWELSQLCRHYHPSVCVFASTLVKVRVEASLATSRRGVEQANALFTIK